MKTLRIVCTRLETSSRRATARSRTSRQLCAFHSTFNSPFKHQIGFRYFTEGPQTVPEALKKTSETAKKEIDYSDPKFAAAEKLAGEAEDILVRMSESTDAAEAVELALEAQKLFLEALAKGGHEYQSKFVFYGLAVTCVKRREYVDAIRWAAKAVEIDDQYVPAFLTLAEAQQMMRHWLDAISAYDKAFTHFLSYYSRAGTEAQRRKANSEELLAEIVVKRSMCYIEIADLDHAEQQLNSVLKLDNIWATEAYVLLGRILQARAKWVPSLELFNKALRRDPKHIDAYLGRLSTYTALGKEDLALQDRKMVVLLRRERLWNRQSVVMDGANVVKK